MADSGFRSSRRDARDADAPRDSVADPLAELARLIGQSEAHGSPDAAQPADGYEDAPAATDYDWAADNRYAEHGRDENRGYAPPGFAEPHTAYQADPAPWPRDRGYADEPAPPRQPVHPAPAFDDLHDDPRHPVGLQDPHYRNEPRAPVPHAQPVAHVPPVREGYRTDGQPQYAAQAPGYGGAYARDEYDDDAAPPRRSGTVVIVAVLGLAVLGTAGALGYRAMFGGQIIPSLPPIIKPGNAPVKIVPNPAAQASAQSQADPANGSSGAQLAPREEQPVEVQSPNQVPRVVTTIPVISNAPGTAFPGGATASGSEPSAPAQPNSSSAFVDPSNPAQVFGSPDQSSPPPAARAPSSGTKAVHTVTIRPGQPSAGNQEPAAPTAPTRVAKPRQPVTRPAREAAPRPSSGGPLSIVPVQQGEVAPAPRPTRTAMARSSAPTPLESERAGTAPASAGGYAVQVSSQRSEAEAQAAFRSLQVKYPQQLGGRRALIRRADLGAKGVYYRALIGPFASEAQAANVCGSLKAAGGNCLIQRD